MKALVPGAETDTRRAVGARERLLAAALRRFGEDGPVAVSLEDVRRTAGVSVGALYHHFADKSALVDALYAQVTEDFQAGFLDLLHASPSAEDGVRRGVRYYLRWVQQHRHETTILLGGRAESPALAELNRRFFPEVMAWWQTHVHYGAVKPMALELIHALWLGPAQEYTRHWLAGHAKRSPAAVGTVLEQAAWDALKEDRARPAVRRLSTSRS
jgi:AcrR family transcriptional regulator